MNRNDFNERLRSAFNEWCIYNAGSARISDQSTPEEISILVEFYGEGTCSVLISSKNGSTQFNIGEEIRFDEVDTLVSDDGTVLSSLMASEVFLLMLEAISAGDVSEEISYSNGKVVASSGSVRIRGTEYKMRVTSLRHSFTRPEKKIKIKYSPARSC